ncbi:MAG TPA: cache domain-containing protein [Vicinamibacterales bacterium]|nr:cache domain-containing protein [Vicinamibacterales bacterium]
MASVGRALSGLRIAGLTAGLCAAAVAGVAYWFFVSQQRQYVIGRDFRILSNLARQVDTAVQAEARVILNLANEPLKSENDFKAVTDKWFKLRGKPYQPADVRFDPTKNLDPAEIPAEYRLLVRPQLFLNVAVTSKGATSPTAVATLRLQPALESLFTSRVAQGAFDAIALGTPEGRVLLSAGPGAQQFRSSGLAVLSSKGTDGKTPVKFAELAQSITMADVSVAGVDYTLFTAPCCLTPHKDAKPLVLAGLVRADTLRAISWAIPTTLVKVAVLALLVALIGWPFLKLILLGDRQQVRASDFFQLGASSIAGLAIITVVVLDVSAYRRLNRDTDAQLRDLAHALDEHATAEVAAAHEQLGCVEAYVLRAADPRLGNGRLDSMLAAPLECKPAAATEATLKRVSAGERLADDSASEWPYPFFETVAFINKDGRQQLKLETAASASNLIDVSERDYFKTVVSGRGWNETQICPDQKCAFESVWSRTTGEALAVLAKPSNVKSVPTENRPPVSVAAISIPMRSLIGPVLPPGFAFAVIDHAGRVLFHSDRYRNGNEDFFVETDNNRRLRAQVAAHSADALNIRYWGAEYRAYLKPMNLPDMYVVAMAQKERAWAINREWLVVSLVFVSVYLVLWLIAALTTLLPNSAWVWPDPARRSRYIAVCIFCSALLAAGAMSAWLCDRGLLPILGIGLPLGGWLGTYAMLRSAPKRPLSGTREPPLLYSATATLVLLVAGVLPGALLFLESYQLHAWSYIKNSQLIVARRLAERYDRLREEYLNNVSGKANARKPAATQIGLYWDRDIYVDFLYNTSIKTAADHGHPGDDDRGGNHESNRSKHDETHHNDSMILSLLEDYLPYYSEASVEWRELLHDRADDDSWVSKHGVGGIRGVEVTFTAMRSSLPVELTSWVPSITHVPPTLSALSQEERPDGGSSSGSPLHPVGTGGSTDVARDLRGSRDSGALLLVLGAGLLALTGGVVELFKRRVYLAGITQPLWACGALARNAGENVLVLCDPATKATQLAGLTPLLLGPIAQHDDFTSAWRRALSAADAESEDGAVLIADFDEALDDARAMERKLALLDDLVSDQSRRVVVVSQVSLRGLTDSLRHSAVVTAAERRARDRGADGNPTDTKESTLERWKRVVKAFVIVERRTPTALEDGRDDVRSSAVDFLVAERQSYPYVMRVCDDLLRSDAIRDGRLTRAQTFDEVIERTLQFYRGLWASCSEDEKVVLGHIAQHGLANASVRSVVRRLLGRGLLRKDPAFRPMNATFRHFILTRECSVQVAALETESGPSKWDRLRAPLGLAVLGVALFLFATQKELYNAIFGVATAAAASVPTLIQAVGKLVGRPLEGPGLKA